MRFPQRAREHEPDDQPATRSATTSRTGTGIGIGMVRHLIRIAATSLLALLILVGGGVSLLLLSFDPNQYKTALSAAVRERYHRALDIQGRLVLHLLPPLTLDTGPMRLSEPDGITPFAQAAGMQLHVDPLALLRRHIVIDRVTLDAPRLVVRRDADGRFNFSDLLPAGPADPSRRGPLDLQTLRVRAGRLMLDDASSGLAGTLSGLDLDLDGLGQPTPRPMQLRARAEFTRPAVNAMIVLGGNLRTGKGPVRLDNFNLQIDGSVGVLQHALLRAVGNAHYAAEAPARLALQGVSIHASGRDIHDRPVDIGMTLPLLAWNDNRVQSSAIDLRAAIGASPAVTRVALHLPAASGPATALRVAGVTLDVHQGNGTVSASRLRLDGTLVLGLGARTAHIDDARLHGAWVLPWGHTLPLDFQGTMAWAPGKPGANATLTGSIAGTGARIAATDSAGLLTLHGDVDALDMEAAGVPSNAVQSVLAQVLPALDGFDVDARLGVGTLRVLGAQWTAAQARVRRDGRAWIVAPADARGVGGVVSASAVIDVGTGRTALALRARGLQAAPIMSALEGGTWLRGTLDGTLQCVLSDVGAPNQLAGSAHVAVHNGKLLGINLGAALRPDNANAIGPARETSFSMASAHFNIAHGVADSTDVALRAGAAQLTGTASLVLQKHTLALALTARQAGTTAAVSVSGAFKAPHFALARARTTPDRKGAQPHRANATSRPRKSRPPQQVPGSSAG